MAELSLEEVIKAFYICRTGDFSKCKDCPYEYSDTLICNVHRNDDALEYLREYRQNKKEYRQYKQEEPVQFDFDNFIEYCPICGNCLDSIEENYCSSCGSKLYWDMDKVNEMSDRWQKRKKNGN